MQINELDREALQDIMFQLEQALYNHHLWYNSIIRSLVCQLPPDKHDIDEDAHKKCRFGQWYYGTVPKILQQHPIFIALGEKHQHLHQVTTKLLAEISLEKAISTFDYDEFANALERMRLEISVLQRELNDFLYNRDALTGAINRVNMLPVLREQQALVSRQVQSCTLAMVDLDHFKEINDRYGHLAGDFVLSDIARFIIEHIRPYDKLFRVGGEEFLICFQNADIKLSLEIVERLRVGLSKLKIAITKESSISLTASFGLSAIETAVPIEVTIEQADKALYKAKNKGRNNIQIWDQEKHIQ